MIVFKQNKRSSPTIWTENASIQTKNGVEALSMMASIVFDSLVRQEIATPVILN